MFSCRVYFIFTLLWCYTSSSKSFKTGEQVPVFVNTIGPYANPQERYKFWDKFPFCQPTDKKDVKQDGGSGLAGDRPRASSYDIRFQETLQNGELCIARLKTDQIEKIAKMVEEDFMFDFFVDELLVEGFLGEQEQSRGGFFADTKKSKLFLFTNWNFNIEYNGNQIISVHMQPDRFKTYELDYTKKKTAVIKFAYSVNWEPVSVKPSERLVYHQRKQVRDQQIQIHWLAIINSFVLVVLLVAFLLIILSRICLKRDYARYAGEDSEELAEDLDDSGWKTIHGDVFRPPRFKMLFAACVGTGLQLLVLMTGILLLSLIGLFYPGNRGALTTAVIVLYLCTAGVAGHVSGKLYSRMGGKQWANNAILTAFTFAGPFSFMFILMNSIAVYYGSTTAIPFSIIAGCFAAWAVITLPLTIYSASKVKDAETWKLPCKTNLAPRELPILPWYRHPITQILCSGILPFTAIYIELHYIFNAIFGHKVYTFFGILCLAFILLVIVASAITVTLTYFQLTIEDYLWWWRSFFTAGSTGFYIFAYAIFFWIYRSNMTGPLQFAFFFGYSAIVSYGFCLMLGSIGFFSSFEFIRHIYGVIKLD